MKRMYTTIYGSKLYGTSTPTSDTDYKSIVKPDIDHLLIAQPIGIVSLGGAAKGEKNTADDCDDSLIPIQIFCQDFIKGQTYAIEVAFSVPEVITPDMVISSDSAFVMKKLVEMRSRFLTSNVNAMVGYAKSQAMLYSNKRKSPKKLLRSVWGL